MIAPTREKQLKSWSGEGTLTSLPVSMLKHILSIPSVTYREERMRDYIIRFAKARKIGFSTDWIGNVYLTKGDVGPGEYVPCFVNHMDTVQDWQREYVDCERMLAVETRKNAEGRTELYVDGCGIGGDNKAGCAIALALMDSLPKCKAVFFVQEETGLVGAQQMDYGFLSDVSLLITMDCWGRIRTAIFAVVTSATAVTTPIGLTSMCALKTLRRATLSSLTSASILISTRPVASASKSAMERALTLSPQPSSSRKAGEQRQ